MKKNLRQTLPAIADLLLNFRDPGRCVPDIFRCDPPDIANDRAPVLILRGERTPFISAQRPQDGAIPRPLPHDGLEETDSAAQGATSASLQERSENYFEVSIRRQTFRINRDGPIIAWPELKPWVEFGPAGW